MCEAIQDGNRRLSRSVWMDRRAEEDGQKGRRGWASIQALYEITSASWRVQSIIMAACTTDVRPASFTVVLVG